MCKFTVHLPPPIAFHNFSLNFLFTHPRPENVQIESHSHLDNFSSFMSVNLNNSFREVIFASNQSTYQLNKIKMIFVICSLSNTQIFVTNFIFRRRFIWPYERYLKSILNSRFIVKILEENCGSWYLDIVIWRWSGRPFSERGRMSVSATGGRFVSLLLTSDRGLMAVQLWSCITWQETRMCVLRFHRL